MSDDVDGRARGRAGDDRDQGPRADAARWQAASAARSTALIALLAPALLAALVAVNTLADDDRLVIDARVPGVLAAAVAIKLKAPVLVVVIVAAVVTAGVRASPGRLRRPMTRYRDLGLTVGQLPPGP